MAWIRGIAWAFKYQSNFQFLSNIYEYTWNKKPYYMETST